MKTKIHTPLDHIKSLIDTYEKMKEGGSLTQNGIGYLDGLRQSYKIMREDPTYKIEVEKSDRNHPHVIIAIIIGFALGISVGIALGKYLCMIG